MPDQPSALDTLGGIVSALPPSVRLRIVDMRIGPTSIVIEGQARDHIGAEILSRSLNRAGLAMDPPRTESLERGGVAFTLIGRPTGTNPVVAAEENDK